jgi:hypothetical protein
MAMPDERWFRQQLDSQSTRAGGMPGDFVFEPCIFEMWGKKPITANLLSQA